jgi:hypothetical protein
MFYPGSGTAEKEGVVGRFGGTLLAQLLFVPAALLVANIAHLLTRLVAR